MSGSRTARPATATDRPHHPLILRSDGTKLSKAGRATGVRELRAAGRQAERIVGQAAAGVGVPSAPVEVTIGDIARLFMT